MATFTSAQSGNWSSSSTWTPTGVPADGDTVTVASGHTVTFDVDQSAFASGLASLTINGELRFTTAASTTTALKVSGNISGSGWLYVGNSLTDRIPRGSKAWIILTGASSIISVANQRYYGWTPARNSTTLAQAASSGASTVVLTDDLDLQAGDEIVIGAGSVTGNQTESNKGVYTVTAYNQGTKTVTVSPVLGHARMQGDAVSWLTRPIEVTRQPDRDVAIANQNNGIAYGVRFSSTRPLNAYNWTISGCTGQNNTYGGIAHYGSGHTISGCTGQNNTIGGIAHWGSDHTISGCTAQNNTYGGIAYYGSGHTISGCTGQNNTYVGIAHWGSGHTISGCTAQNNTYGGIAHAGSGHTISGCTGKNNMLGGIAHGGSGHTISGCTGQNNTIGGIAYWGSDHIISGCTAQNNTYGGIAYYGSGHTISGCTSGPGQSGMLYGPIGHTSISMTGDTTVTAFTDPSVHSKYVTVSYNDGGTPENHKWYCRGGYVERVSSVSPPGFSYSYRATLQSSTYPAFLQLPYRVRAGSRIRFYVPSMKMQASTTMKVQIVDPFFDPLAIPGQPPLAEQNVSQAGQWVNIVIEWLNDRGIDADILLRVIGYADSDNWYAWPVQAAGQKAMLNGIPLEV